MNSVTRITMIALAMFSFAGNSLLSRLALSTGASDAVSFTTVRLLSAALVLALLVRLQKRPEHPNAAAKPAWVGWASALALFAYAANFSWAYLLMPAATGALILFGAVQLTMVIAGLLQGERLQLWQCLGFALALIGMAALTLPTFSTPSALSALAMLSAGVAWGIYSLLGRQATQPLQNTASNFLRTLPMVGVLVAFTYPAWSMNSAGFLYALIAGALTSGIGYALWYAVLPSLKASSAAGLQLSVPVITVCLGALILQEPVTFRIVLSCAAILGGSALVLFAKRKLHPSA
jgi:drug/metabolite transporter (DMT)-like permease